MSRASDESRLLPRAILAGVSALLLIVAIIVPIAQDWVPFQIAAELAAAGEWQAVYLSPAAASLADVSPQFRDRARDELADAAPPSFAAEDLTAFVAPPPAAFLLSPLRHRTWRTSMIAMRLSLALPLVAALVIVGERMPPRSYLRWALICAVSAWLLSYAVAWGQPIGWLVVAVMCSLVPASLGVDAAGGVTLALAVLTKATPLVAVAALWLTGRRRLAVLAVALVAAAVVITCTRTGADAWRAFFAASRHLAAVVPPYWNNASIDALLVRLTTGDARGLFREPRGVVLAASWAARATIIGAGLWSATKRAAPAARRASAIWIGWLALTPLLWLHYLLVLVPLLASTPVRPRDPAIALAATLTAPLLLHAGGAPDAVTGAMASAAWLIAAAWLLSDAAWRPAWNRTSSVDVLVSHA